MGPASGCGELVAAGAEPPSPPALELPANGGEAGVPFPADSFFASASARESAFTVCTAQRSNPAVKETRKKKALHLTPMTLEILVWLRDPVFRLTIWRENQLPPSISG